jgi:RNA polymerase sigma-70 factor, ECF subfamily
MRSAVPELNDPDSHTSTGQQVPSRTALDVVRSCIQSGEQAAWLEFVSRFQPMLEGAVAKAARRWTTPAPALVDDLVQATYLKLCANHFRALRELECAKESSLFGFLKVVASHVVQDHFRNSSCQKRGNGRAGESMELSIGNADPIAPASHEGEQRILFSQIEQCLQSHATGPHCERDFAIFWLYYRQGFTAKEISERPEIGISIKGVESTLLRLTRILRAKLTRSHGRTPWWQRRN